MQNFSFTYASAIASFIVMTGILEMEDALSLVNAIAVLIPLIGVLYGRWQASSDITPAGFKK